MATVTVRTPKAIRDEDENNCKFTDTKAFTEAQCGIMITEDYKDGCLVLQCPLPPITKKELKEGQNVPICSVHNEDEGLDGLPVWKGPVPGLTPVPDFKRPTLTTKITTLYSKYDQTMKTSEGSIQILLRTIRETVARKESEEKKQAELSAELRREIADVKERLNTCKEEKNKVVAYEATVADRIQRLQDEKKRVEEELQNTRAQSASAIKKLERGIEQAQTERKQQEIANREMENKNLDAIRQLETKTTQLTAELQSTRQQLSRVGEIKTAELAEAKRFAERLAQELKESKAELESKRKEVQEALKAREDATASSATSLQEYKREIERKINKAKRRAAATTARLNSEKRQALTNIRAEKKKLLQAEEQKIVLDDEIRRLKEHISAAATERKAVDQQVAECRVEVDRLNKEMAELSSQR